jgi:ribose transport system substrate-binding protein
VCCVLYRQERLEMRSRQSKVLLTIMSGIIVAVAVAAMTSTGGAATTLYIAGVSPFTADPSLKPTDCGAKAEAKRLGVKWSWGGPSGPDVPKEVSYLSSIMLKKPDGVLLLPLSPTAFVNPVRQLMSDGVPVVLTDGTLTPRVQYRSYQSDFSNAGRLVRDGVLQLTGGTGTVGVVAFGADKPLDRVRWEPAVKLLKNSPGIKVLPVEYSNADTVKSASIAAALIRGHADLKVIVATNGPEATGVASAVLAAGKKGKVHIIAYDAPATVIRRIKDGSIAFTISQSPYVKGRQAVRDLVNYIRKNGSRSGPVAQSKPIIVPVPTKKLTKANIDSPQAKLYIDSSDCSFFD